MFPAKISPNQPFAFMLLRIENMREEIRRRDPNAKILNTVSLDDDEISSDLNKAMDVFGKLHSYLTGTTTM